jgi:hypothetical protein
MLGAWYESILSFTLTTKFCSLHVRSRVTVDSFLYMILDE